MTSIASRISQIKYGEGVCNIVIIGTKVNELDFRANVYPDGIEKEPNQEAIEKYGLAVKFARILREYKEFFLSAPQSGVANIFCGLIIWKRIVPAMIVIDNSTLDFLAGGPESSLSLKEGHPMAVARIVESGDTPIEVYFFDKVRPLAP